MLKTAMIAPALVGCDGKVFADAIPDMELILMFNWFATSKGVELGWSKFDLPEDMGKSDEVIQFETGVAPLSTKEVRAHFNNRFHKIEEEIKSNSREEAFERNLQRIRENEHRWDEVPDEGDEQLAELICKVQDSFEN